MKRTRRNRRSLVAMLTVAIGLIAAPGAGAAIIDVTTTEDQWAAGPECSLREAINAASTDAPSGFCTAGAGADTIRLPAGTYTLTRAGANEDAGSTGDLDAYGSNAITIAPEPADAKVIIDGGGLDRVLSHSGLGSLELRNLTVQGGSTPPISDGGGILNQNGALTLTGVTVRDNATTVDGGGLANYASAIIVNSTFSGNQAGNSGGGFYGPGGSDTTVRSATLTANTADSNGDNGGGGGGFATAGTVNTFNTIIAGNRDDSPVSVDPDCQSGPNFFPRFTLSSQPLGPGNCLVGFNPGTNIVTADPKLAALADNGGPTPTVALLEGSPAIDAAGAAAPDECPPVDQRGVERPAGQCDIGAYEFVAGGGGGGGGGGPDGTAPKLAIAKLKPKAPKVKPNKVVTVSVTVANSGNADASGVKVCAKLSKKVKKALKPKGKACKSLGAVAEGTSKVAKLKLRATGKAKKGKKYGVRFELTATGQGKTSKSVKVKVR